MSSQQPEPRPLPVLGSPRSPVWRWLLGTSSTAAYALITALLSGLVLSTFSNSRIGQFVGTTLGGLSWVVLAGSAAYVVLRVAAGIRERRLTARDLALTADLVAPGPPVRIDGDLPEPAEGASATHEWLDQCDVLLRAIDQLAVPEFDVDALLAVHAALVDAPDRLPLRPQAGDRESAVRVLNLLVHNGFLVVTPAGRLARTAKPAALESDTSVQPYALETARPALLQHYADLAVRWSKALDTTALAQGAARWFELEEPYLRGLIDAHPASDQRRSVLVELSRITDALDVWYVRIGQPEARRKVAERLRALVPEEAFPMLHALACARAGEHDRAAGGFAPRRVEATTRARRDHHSALADLADALSCGDGAERSRRLADVEERLERVWWNLARNDVAGEVCALVNLAVIHLYQGRLEAAQDRLELAESLTSTGKDPGGRAQALEIRGIVCWAQGTPRRAIAYWQRSLRLFRELGEAQGEGRCLQHLGSALAVAPALGGLVVTPPSGSGDGRLDQAAVGRHATRLLRTSKRLRRTGPDGQDRQDRMLADEYLELLAPSPAEEPETGSADVPAVEADEAQPPGLLRQLWRWLFG